MLKIVTGGQTGVDRAALDVALALGIPCSGWCPKGRLAEDGEIDAHYPLKETPSEDVAQRTEWNARDSDGTLILNIGNPTDGTPLTAQMAEKYNKPYITLELDKDPELSTFKKWLAEHNIKTLNIAGPRESHAPGEIYSLAKKQLETLLA